VLGDLYYEFAQEPAYIKEYRTRDLKIVAECFEKTVKVTMNDFVKAFANQLSRNQIKYLIMKLEIEGLIIKDGLGRWAIYKLTEKIDNSQSIFKQFQFTIER